MIRKRHALGFTLTELLVVIGIVSILAIVAIPSFISYLQQNRLQGNVLTLYYALQNARMAAVKNNTTVYVSFTTGSSWCYGINAGSACSCATPSGCSLGAFTAPAANQLTLSTSGVTGSLQFEGTHGATYTTSTLTFTVYGQSTSMGVYVTPMGDLLVCSSNVSGYPACS